MDGINRRKFLSVIGMSSAGFILSPLCKNAAFIASKDTVKANAKIINYKDHQIYQINGENSFPALYSAIYSPVRSPYSEHGEENYSHFSDAGINLNEFSVNLDTVWKKDGTLDEKAVNENLLKEMRGVLEINPESFFQVRIQLSVPTWWMKKNMHEVVRYAEAPIEMDQGDPINRALRPSLASIKWREDATVKLRELLNYLQNSTEGNRVFSFLISAGVYGEWHYYGFQHEPDTGGAMTDYFRQWLREKYGTDRALQKAWNEPTATIASTKPPNMEKRVSHKWGMFRNPKKEREIIDYYQCHQEVIAEDISHFSRIIKETWSREVIVGIFYGYLFFHMGGYNAGGHLELDQILECPDVDFLSAPFNYYKVSRGLGGTGQLRGLPKSVRLHNKLYMNEQDNRTYLDNTGNMPAHKVYSFYNVQESLAKMRTNFAQAITSCTGYWMFDFGKIGSWNNPALMKEVKHEYQFANRQLESSYKNSADVLFVYDMKSFYYLAETSNKQCTEMVKSFTSWMTNDTYHSGAVFENILFSDLDRVNFDHYKVIVFADTYLMSDQQIAFVREKVASDGRTLIWNYASGYTNGQTLDSNRISKVTGINVTPISLKRPPEIVTTNPTVTFGLGEEGDAGTVPVNPLFAVDDPSAETLGNYKGTELTAIARKKTGDSTSIYLGLPMRNPIFIRHLFREAGAHIYNQDGDVLFGGGGILTISSKRNGGVRSIKLKNNKKVSFNLPAATTKIIDINTGEVLLGT